MVSQGVGGHEGYSGTPFWKIQQQNQKVREAALAESLSYVVDRKPIRPPNLLVDAVSLGGPSGRPFARHVLVKCLRKVADRSKVDLPSTDLFKDKAPMGLFALFDGQAGAGEPGPAAAEFCARNFHKKVMDNLSALPPHCTSEAFVKAALVKSFEDLDQELLDTQPDIKDGCGAAVVLTVGDHLFTAVLGGTEGVLCEVPDAGGAGRPRHLGKSQGRCYLPEERSRLVRVGANVVGEGNDARVCGPGGLTSAVTRSLGDAVWKRPASGVSVLSCMPEVQSLKLSWADKHPFLILASRPVSEALTSQELLDLGLSVYPMQPRAATGEASTLAMDKIMADKPPGTPPPQCTTVMVWFLPGGPSGGVDDDSPAVKDEGPAKKKAKVGASAGPSELASARLRHILVRFQDGAKDQPGIKNRIEAEAVLRRIARELKAELDELRKKPGMTRKPEELALRSEKFSKLCKEHSECPTSQKGGGMCGDLGWMSKDAQRKLGDAFREGIAVLRPGDWSDITASVDGLHLIQRIA